MIDFPADRQQLIHSHLDRVVCGIDHSDFHLNMRLSSILGSDESFDFRLIKFPEQIKTSFHRGCRTSDWCSFLSSFI